MKRRNFFIIALTTALSFSLVFIPDTSLASQSDNDVLKNNVTLVTNYNVEYFKTNSNNISPEFVNPYRYRKIKEDVTYEWSPFRRVSSNLNTYNSGGGSIKANRKTTFGVSVSGNIFGLGISTSGSISSQIGYTLNVPKNRRVYMGYRVRYKVEKGIREVRDVVTGKKTTNKYTVKTPLYGEYKLRNYR